MTKSKLTFKLIDVEDEVIGEGNYYEHGGNIQLFWHKFTPGGGALQFHSLAEAMLLKGVQYVSWDKHQDGKFLTKDGWEDESEYTDDMSTAIDVIIDELVRKENDDKMYLLGFNTDVTSVKHLDADESDIEN